MIVALTAKNTFIIALLFISVSIFGQTMQVLLSYEKKSKLDFTKITNRYHTTNYLANRDYIFDLNSTELLELAYEMAELDTVDFYGGVLPIVGVLASFRGNGMLEEELFEILEHKNYNTL
ncbi:MAG: hypothetical protein K8S56_01740, partial [Candidatus Cloacimonetes bacterium]|nr:hypothetical protein [Candidatus Cloacimonadota bacterium]